MKILTAAIALILAFMAWWFTAPTPDTIAVMAAAVVLMGGAVALHSRST